MGTGLQLFSNNATATLAASVTSGATSLSVTSGEGAAFPALSAGEFFVATLMHLTGSPPTVASYEIVQVTARSTDTMTIVRAQEGTTAAAWAAGDTLALLPTMGGLEQLVQPVQAQASSYNYASDTGSANAYSVTLTPALTAHVAGMPIRWLAGHTNTGSSTFNDGVATVALVLANGAALPPGTIAAGGIYTTIWNATLGAFQLSAYSGIIGTIPNSSLTYTGFGTPPELIIGYSVTNGVVTLIVSNLSTGVSNNASFVVGGLPAIICPPSPGVMVGVVGLLDNLIDVPGGAVIVSSAGSLTFYKDGSQSGWTATGTKGFSVSLLGITYPIFLP